MMLNFVDDFCLIQCIFAYNIDIFLQNNGVFIVQNRGFVSTLSKNKPSIIFVYFVDGTKKLYYNQ